MPETAGPAGPGALTAIREAWDGLLAAAGQAGYAVDELIRSPATAGQLAAAQDAIGRRLPAGLAALYQLSDGQNDYGALLRGTAGRQHRERGRWLGALFGADWAFRTLEQLVTDYRLWADIRGQYDPAELAANFDDMITVRGGDPVRPLYTCADWVPFATDGGGNSLAADLAPAPGGAAGQVIVIGSDEDLRRVLAPSVLDLLRLCAGRLGRPLTDLYVRDGVALYTLEVDSELA